VREQTILILVLVATSWQAAHAWGVQFSLVDVLNAVGSSEHGQWLDGGLSDSDEAATAGGEVGDRGKTTDGGERRGSADKQRQALPNNALQRTTGARIFTGESTAWCHARRR